jgi:hypothetical protein
MEYSSPIVAALQLSNVILDSQEEHLLEKVDEFESKKTEIEIFSKMIHALTLAKQSNKDLLIEDEEIKKLAIYIHRYDPNIFGDWVEKFPEGTLIEPITPSDPSIEAFLNAGCEGLTLSEVEFGSIPRDCIDAITHRLTDIQQKNGTDVTQLVNKMQMLYGDQGQFVEIMRAINDQHKALLEQINRHMTG